MPDVLMPRLSDSMEEGTILRWLKAEGDEVTRGEEIVEIETDKATMTYEADDAGVLAIVVGEGATVSVGGLIARVGDGAAPVDAPAASAEVAAPPRRRPGVNASPVARRLAQRLGVALEGLTGSGPYGRVVKADVARASEHAAGNGHAAPAPAAPAPQPASADATVEELTRTQAVIARRMAEARATVPDFELRTEVDMEAAVELRARLKELPGDQAGPSLNDFVVKAAALALRDHPRANGSYRDGQFELHPRVNVGVAVTAQDALVVPTVTDADQKSLGAIARESRALAERARAGTVTPAELSGGTFTVSNLGMYGVTSFSAVVNPPQAAILAVGAVVPRPVVRHGEIVIRHVMELALACDHRILYGADAARFLASIRERLEAPMTLVLS